MPLQGVLQDVQQAFYGLCIEAGWRVQDVMMEADRETLCGPQGVPDAQRRAVRGGHTTLHRSTANGTSPLHMPIVFKAFDDGDGDLCRFPVSWWRPARQTII